ncbi:hypothetical protein HU200_009133 [Digitaria exilis]|uniref:Uncharacterized protein n=1 Tax=Digitaria exilis TaxID=1010633 RepID=A0A835FJE2_9POAL|nr:hypothetical protein HU200_009133 [Digitaria exilis]
MLSWPCCRNRTAVEGNVSHRGRDMDDISLQNPFNLTTKMAEVDITSDVGSSGAVLFDAWGEGVGMLHGGDKCFSYFISLDAIRQTLAQWGK